MNKTDASIHNINNFQEIVFYLFLFLIILFPKNALATLTAESDLSFVNNDYKDDYGNHSWGHSLTQKYSILYSKRDKLLNGRLGDYNINAGYEILSLDTKTSSNQNLSNNQTKGHFIYSGSILIDPKEMPFRLKIYSSDMTSGTFEKSKLSDNDTSLDYLSNYSNHFDLTTKLNSGIHRETGATLIAGVKNGMTNGYNEYLRHFPMILLDYRDRVNKDNLSDNRLTQLAFVSLNKKENWFHYRYAIYNDFITPSNNYHETQMQLGTVDQILQRRWIDFTNWLQVSTDSLYINHDAPIKTDTYQEISFNMFGKINRQSWNAYMYNSFIRRAEVKPEQSTISNYSSNITSPSEKIFTYTTSIPLYVNGTINKATSWDSSLLYNDNHTSNMQKFNKFNSTYNIYALKNSPFTITQGLLFEYAESENLAYKSNMIALTNKLETNSTKKFSNKLSIGALSLTKMYNYNLTNGQTNQFIDSELSGKLIYSLNNKLQFSINQLLRTTAGKSGKIETDITNADTSTSQYYSPVNDLSSPTNTFESGTIIRFDWHESSRLSAQFGASNKIYLSNTAYNESTNTISLGTTYKLPTLTIKGDASYENSSNHYNNYIISNKIDYSADRSLLMYLKTSYSKFEDNSSYNINDTRHTSTGEGVTFEQGLRYNFYQKRGLIRKVLEVNEEFKTGVGIINNAVASNYTNSTRTNEFSLGLRYFPINALTLGFGSRYNFTTSFKDYVALYYASAALTYRLFETSVDFIHGRNSADGRVEKKVAVNVKKRF